MRLARMDHTTKLVPSDLKALANMGVADLTEAGTPPVPRVHGNGFIQLDITEHWRLHIWGHPDIPRQRVATPIHDHVFGFRSFCLVGRLVNVVYDTLLAYDVDRVQGLGAPHPEFVVHQPVVRDGEDTVLRQTDDRVFVRPRYAECVSAGGNKFAYDMPSFVFHETFVPEPTATLMYKHGPTHTQGSERPPSVLVPVGKTPDNNFRRDAFEPDKLWRVINDVIFSV